MQAILDSLHHTVIGQGSVSELRIAQAAHLSYALESGLLSELSPASLMAARQVFDDSADLYADYITLALILEKKPVSRNPALTSERFELSLTQARRAADLVRLFNGHITAFFNLTLEDIELFWPLVARIYPYDTEILTPVAFLYGLRKSLEALRIGRHSPFFCDRGQILVSASALVNIRKCALAGLSRMGAGEATAGMMLNFGHNDPMLSQVLARLRESAVALGRVYARDSTGLERIYLTLTHEVSLPILNTYPVRTLAAQTRPAGIPVKNAHLFSLCTQQGWTSVTVRVVDTITLKNINLINTVLAGAETSFRTLTDVRQSLIMPTDDTPIAENTAIGLFLPIDALEPALKEKDFLRFLQAAPLSTFFYYPDSEHAPWVYWQPHPESEVRRGLVLYCDCVLAFDEQHRILSRRLMRLNHGAIAQGVRIAEVNYRQILATLTDVLPLQRTDLNHSRVQLLTHFFRTLTETPDAEP